MAASRIVLAIGVTVSLLSLVGCDRAVVPSPGSVQPSQSPSTSPAPASPPPSVAPSPIGSVEPSAVAAKWLLLGELREGRNATHAVALGTGEVLVVGSDNVCAPATAGSDSVEIGQPETGVWEMTASLPRPRETPVLVSLQDGRALLTGGETGEEGGPAAYSSTYIFDPANRSWSRSALLNTARTKAAAVVLADGKVLVAGGFYTDGTQVSFRVLDSSEVWDRASGTWSRSGNLFEGRFGAAAAALADGRVLIVGGVASPETAPDQQSSAEIYDPRSGEWSSGGELASPRRDFALVALPDGGALVAGGLANSDAKPLTNVERFDPVSNTWSPAADLPVPVSGASGIRLADGRVLLAGGGSTTSGLTADAVLFAPETGEWTATTPMPGPRAGASPVLMADGSVIFAGGFGAAASPGDTPSCPEPDPRVLLYVPGS